MQGVKPSRAARPALSSSTAASVLQALAPRELRLTAHRRAVLGALEHAGRPLSTDEVVARASVPTSTAYRILAQLVDAGVVVRVTGAGGSDRHELAEPFSRHHHHHLVCVDCGLVTDFDPSPRLERLIEREILELPGASGFEPSHHVFDVRGRCAACASVG
jgi:Fe2+ or Zn2+ uptake regulation protein